MRLRLSLYDFENTSTRTTSELNFNLLENIRYIDNIRRSEDVIKRRPQGRSFQRATKMLKRRLLDVLLLIGYFVIKTNWMYIMSHTD